MDTEIIVSFLIFIFIWLALFVICLPWLINRLDSWRRLKNLYLCDNPFSGRIWRPLLFSIRGDGWLAINYAWLHYPFTKLAGNAKGLYIACPSPLFLSYNWIMVPWEDLITKRKSWAFPNFEILFKKEYGISVLISSGMAHELAILAGNSWPELD